MSRTAHVNCFLLGSERAFTAPIPPVGFFIYRHIAPFFDRFDLDGYIVGVCRTACNRNWVRAASRAHRRRIFPASSPAFPDTVYTARSSVNDLDTRSISCDNHHGSGFSPLPGTFRTQPFAGNFTSEYVYIQMLRRPFVFSFLTCFRVTYRCFKK